MRRFTVTRRDGLKLGDVTFYRAPTGYVGDWKARTESLGYRVLERREEPTSDGLVRRMSPWMVPTVLALGYLTGHLIYWASRGFAVAGR